MSSSVQGTSSSSNNPAELVDTAPVYYCDRAVIIAGVGMHTTQEELQEFFSNLTGMKGGLHSCEW